MKKPKNFNSMSIGIDIKLIIIIDLRSMQISYLTLNLLTLCCMTHILR